MRYLTLLLGVVLSAVAVAQTTQPSKPEKLTDLFKPYEERIMARIAELPNVPTQAQMEACRVECDAIGDEFEQAVKLKYVWYCGFTSEDQKRAEWGSGRVQCSPREMKMGAWLQPNRPLRYIVGYSERLKTSPSRQAILEGQVVSCTITMFIQRDNIKSGPTDVSTTVAYPLFNAFLNAGNIIPPTFQLP